MPSSQTNRQQRATPHPGPKDKPRRPWECDDEIDVMWWQWLPTKFFGVKKAKKLWGKSLTTKWGTPFSPSRRTYQECQQKVLLFPRGLVNQELRVQIPPWTPIHCVNEDTNTWRFLSLFKPRMFFSRLVFVIFPQLVPLLHLLGWRIAFSCMTWETHCSFSSDLIVGKIQVRQRWALRQ